MIDRGVLGASALYAALAIAISWPLAAHLGSQVAGDLGDPLLVIWVMARVSTYLTRVLQGDLSAFAEMWNANIFHPEPNTLAYSEHFAGQAILTLPLWWITHNPMLIYNVATLASFVLTGLGAFLLTRAFTGGFTGPAAAGVFAAFNSYRLTLEFSHLHVLSIHWFLFALVALHRYIERGTWQTLVAVIVCDVLMNLSSGYFMMYGAPLLTLFGLLDLAIQKKLTDLNRWLGLAIAVPAAVLLTSPFILPYLQMQRQTGFDRPMADVIAHSARFGQYAAFVLPWAQVPIALALAAFVARTRPARPYVWALFAVLAFAFVLSLGPFIQPWNVRGPYWWLYQYAPGFHGLRVVNRFGALFLVMLAIMAGCGAAFVARLPRAGHVIVTVATAVFLWQIWPAHFPINVPIPSPELAPAPAYLEPSMRLPSIYEHVEALPDDAVLLELPFGDYWYDLRYMYFSVFHGRHLVNGYSGFFPASYLARQRVLLHPLLDPERSGPALLGATHVIVHRGAWPDGTGTRIASWIESIGGHLVAGSGDALLYQMQTTERLARTRGE